MKRQIEESAPVSRVRTTAARDRGEESTKQPTRVGRMQETLGNQAIQRLDEAGSEGGMALSSVHAVAERSVQGRGKSVPYRSQLEGHFDRETLSIAEVHTDQRARRAARELGARAYTVGERIALRATPDLETVAHELTHVAQQRRGARPERGVGRRGDQFERTADRVAAAVGGDSDTTTITGPGGRTVADGSATAEPVQFQRLPGRSIPPDDRGRAKQLQSNTVKGIKSNFDVRIPITPQLLAVIGSSGKRGQGETGTASDQTGTAGSAISSGTAAKTGGKDVAKTADKYSKPTTISSGKESVGGISPGDVTSLPWPTSHSHSKVKIF